MYTIGVDSSMSPGNRKDELLAISVKYLDSSNNITEKYLAVKDMQGLDSNAYLNCLLGTLEQWDLLKGLYFIATDGAPVVASNKSGLYGLLMK